MKKLGVIRLNTGLNFFIAFSLLQNLRTIYNKTFTKMRKRQGSFQFSWLGIFPRIELKLFWETLVKETRKRKNRKFLRKKRT